MGVTTLHSFMAILAVLEISIEERERIIIMVITTWDNEIEIVLMICIAKCLL